LIGHLVIGYGHLTGAREIGSLIHKLMDEIKLVESDDELNSQPI